MQFTSSTEDIPVTAGAAPPASTEVVPRPKRRFNSNAEKRRIVAEADACTSPGEIGLLMRCEGIYSSHFCNWRQQIQAAYALALDAKKRPKTQF